MDDYQLLAWLGALTLGVVYAIYVSLRSRAATLWNAQDIGFHDEILVREYPQYYQDEMAREPPEPVEPEAWRKELALPPEQEEEQEVPA